MAALVSLLHADAVLHGDGGGKALATKRAGGRQRPRGPVHHRDRPGLCLPDATHEEIELNGAPGLMVRAGGRTVVAILIDTDGELINSVFAIANPDKLGLQEVSGLGISPAA